MAKDMWDQVLGVMGKKVNKQLLETWLKRTKFVSFQDGVLLLEVPSRFFRDWLKEHYYDVIMDALSSTNNKATKIDFSIIPQNSDAEFNGENTRPSSPPFQMHLNPRYTLDNFVVGESNRVAHAASLAVSESPSKAYNPLFIYGGVGLGKTHLMQAIAHFIRGKNPQTKIFYISTETFTNQWIDSIQNRTTEKFRNMYRNADVLLVDDIHFLAGKETTQEQFFHTFNILYDAYKQIVISCDRPPKEIPTLQERLVSRFEWGLVVDIQPPSLETRVAILKKKQSKEGFHLPDDVVFYIANTIKINIRQLEGALIRVVAHASLTGNKITLSLAQETLKDAIRQEDKQINIETIQKEVARFYGMEPSGMQAKKRSKSVVLPRQIAMFLTRDLTDHSLPEIGKAFGGRDHATVIHACQKIENDSQQDLDLKHSIDQIKRRLVG
ncbi:chromosomal replication initiator protein DnaA [bacterium]|nr:chromosomal replication initiator protein DnaA [bacterium]